MECSSFASIYKGCSEVPFLFRCTAATSLQRADNSAIPPDMDRAGKGHFDPLFCSTKMPLSAYLSRNPSDPQEDVNEALSDL